MSSQDTLGEKMNRIVARVTDRILPKLQETEPTISTISCLYGPWKEIQNKLIDMTKNDQQKLLKFPLIAIIESYPEGHGNQFYELTLQVYIFYYTNKNFSSAERDGKVYSPILEPIKREFLRQLSLSQYFFNNIAATIPFTQVNMKNFGKSSIYGSDGHLVADYVDALYLKDLKLLLKSNCFC